MVFFISGQNMKGYQMMLNNYNAQWIDTTWTIGSYRLPHRGWLPYIGLICPYRIPPTRIQEYVTTGTNSKFKIKNGGINSFLTISQPTNQSKYLRAKTDSHQASIYKKFFYNIF